MDMKLEHRQAFTVIGFSAQIKPEEGYEKCPEFWEMEYNRKYQHLWETGIAQTPGEQAILGNRIGMLALCAEEMGHFEYMIGGIYGGGCVPDEFKLYTFPESDWLIFSAKGPLPQSLQQLNTEVWQKWYPTQGKEFTLIGTASVEYYSAGDPRSPDYECGIWLPIKAEKYAYCGLNCQSCDAYLATVNDDQALREKTARVWSELNHAEITPDMIRCKGCCEDGVKTPYCEYLCEIRKCAVKKGIPSCGSCADMENCETLKPMVENNQAALEHLNTIHG